MKPHANGFFIPFYMEIYPARHIVGFTPGDLEIPKSSALHSICFCRQYLLLRGLFTTNSNQYLQLQNLKKYEHTYDAKLDYMIVINKQTREPKGIFDYEELLAFLGENNHHDCLSRVLKLWTDSNPEGFKITEMSDKGFHLKAHIYEGDDEGIDFTFVKNESYLMVFKGAKKEINGECLCFLQKVDSLILIMMAQKYILINMPLLASLMKTLKL